MTQKPRVYQVAKDFNVSSEALLGILDDLGHAAKSHMSTVDDSVVDLLRQRFTDEKDGVSQSPAAQAPGAQPTRESSTATATTDAAPPESKPAPEEKPPAPAAEEKRAEPEAPAAPAEPERPRRTRRVVDEKTVRDSVKRTLATLEESSPKRFKKKETAPAVKPETSPAPKGKARGRGKGKGKGKGRGAAPAAQPAVAEEKPSVDGVIRVTELSSVAEVAEQLDVKPAEVITKLMGMGTMATLNHRLDKDSIELVAMEFGKTVEFQEEFVTEEVAELEEAADDPAQLVTRAPVVTVMGHVDHGKTSLLDHIRKANVVAGEKGGITQHIGAYEVTLDNGREVTFLDTPGHQAFTAMRARGARVTDIVILVVAADDRVMPQTVEAIDHARAAEVPIIVAINKVDKPEANLTMVKQDLAQNNLLVEEFGGQVPSVDLSAKTGQGMDDLLELILLQADLLELTANPERRARGVVIESKVEQGRGTVATVLVQTGTLNIGDPFVCGNEFGKVRALSNERGKRVKSAGPSTPVEVTGWSGPPTAGDLFQSTADEAQAKEVGQHRQLLAREAEHQRHKHVTLQEFHAMLEKGEVRELNLIIKADVGGSMEVLAEQLGAQGTDEVSTKVIHAGVGQINESDILLADASNAVIIGFNVKVDPKAKLEAERSEVDVRLYSIIYEAVEDVKSALSGLLKPEEVETIRGHAEVRQLFRVSRTGTIAGSYVLDGNITRNNLARVQRNGELVGEGKIGSLKRFKDDVKEVASGYECGIGLDGYDKLEEGDIIETYEIELVARRIN